MDIVWITTRKTGPTDLQYLLKLPFRSQLINFLNKIF